MSLNTILATAPLTTSGYHIKANGTTLGNSLIWDNGTNVGIGNTNTSYTLDVSGTGRFTGALTGTSATFSSITANGLIYGRANASFPTSGLGYYALKTNNLDGERGGLTIQVSSSTNTLTDALSINYTGAATFSSSVTTNANNYFNNTSGRAFDATSDGVLMAKNGGAHNIIFGDGNVRYYSLYTPSGAAYGSIRNFSTSTDILSFTSGGNVGIGTSSPTDKFVVSNGNANTLHFDVEFSGGASTIYSYNRSTNAYTNLQLSGSNLIFQAGGSTERMRITSGGQLMVGTTLGLGGRIVVNNNASSGISIFDGSNSGGFIQFFNNGAVQIGSIVTTNGFSTTYNSTSDYRLKEDLKEFNGLEKVSAIKVYNYKWKGIDDRMDGVLAHELQEVLPYAVNGEKDGEQMQGVDYSKIVPVLVKAIQEMNTKLDEQNQTIQNLQAQIETQDAKIEELKALIAAK